MLQSVPLPTFLFSPVNQIILESLILNYILGRRISWLNLLSDVDSLICTIFLYDLTIWNISFFIFIFCLSRTIHNLSIPQWPAYFWPLHENFLKGSVSSLISYTHYPHCNNYTLSYISFKLFYYVIPCSSIALHCIQNGIWQSFKSTY